VGKLMSVAVICRYELEAFNIVVPLPPGENPFAVKINISIYI
jgi:hypothetical protein